MRVKVSWSCNGINFYKAMWLLNVMVMPLLMSPMVKAEDTVDILIHGGQVFRGANEAPEQLEIAISNGRIHSIGKRLDPELKARKHIDASGMIVAPGFIDPHTHADIELNSTHKNANLNYLTQGVTTVFIGNDGGGTVNVQQTLTGYQQKGVGTNVATFIGHGALRRSVMGTADRAPTSGELQQMKDAVARAMEEGALGLSTGLYYVPGSYADADEIIELARVAGQYGGIYDSHIRDESSYSIGLKAAIEEVLEVARQTGIAVHIAHIKALGVDVWGQSRDVVAMIDEARKSGLTVTADQYPWRASGTSIEGALMPRWVMSGSEESYHNKLKNPDMKERIIPEMTENLRRRGGAEALLITDRRKPDLVGKTLAQVARDRGMAEIEAALSIILDGGARVASFNMSLDDIRHFMIQPWVMTSSDGSSGHPRKYASYPKKYQDYVLGEKILSLGSFIYQSSGRVADVFGLKDRGYIRQGYIADLIIFEPEEYRPKADFSNPERLAEGMKWLLLNGNIIIEDGYYNGKLEGQAIRKGQ